MNQFIKVKIKNNTYVYPKGTTLLEISKQFQVNYDFPILVAYVNNTIFELNHVVEDNCNITFIDCTNRIGNRIYQKGLMYLLIYSIKELYGYEYTIKACHSIDKGINIKCYFNLNRIELNKIKDKMIEIVKEKKNITRCLVKRKEALNYFNKINNSAKAKTYLYTTDHYINLYKLGDMYNYFYSAMPISTEVFTLFDLKLLDNNQFILQFPTIDGIIPEYTENTKIIEAFNENYKYAKRLNIFCSSDINEIITEGRISDIIKLDEVMANNKLLDLAKQISNQKDKIKVVLIAGPSSSGKTTTARKLSMFLQCFGINPKPLSIDDYFLPREKTPKLPNGDYDFESLNAIDIKLFNEQLTRILNHEEAEIPTFNFKTGVSEYTGKKLKLEENDIIIVEGLHGLNEELTKDISHENKFKIYVSPLTDLNIDNHIMVSTSDNRLLRRIVRDNRTRGYSAEETIKTWNRVRDGEEKYVFPYQNEADYVYNSALIYEIGVLKLYAEPLLYNIDISSQYYEEARRLLKFLEMFLAIPPESIPTDSILREFIGGSYFE